MKNTIQNHLIRLRRNRSRKKKAAAMLVCLSLVVAVGVSWSLRMTGESQSAETYCGMEEHSHSEACIQRTLTCGLDESGADGGHTHSPDCYEERQTLLCQQEEHSHSTESGCFDADGTLTCQAQEHVHGGSCYLSEPVLICGQQETVPAESSGDTGHVHTDACYEVSYTCGFEQEHTHALACYSNPEADVETSADWEQTVSDVQLTGNFAEDLLAIAKTQLGYKESKDNYTMVTDADGEERTKGYTRYGAWYGDPYGDWCAMFVSFCLNYADIPEDVFPRDASCGRWVETLSEEDWEMFRSAASYSPYPGDLVFFDTDQDGVADHVGIVSGLTPEYTGTESYYEDDETYTLTGIKTIEGNSDDMVAECEYGLTDKTILGYGVLPDNDVAAYALNADPLTTTLSPASTLINLFDYKANNGTSWAENGSNQNAGINNGHYLKFINSGGAYGTANWWTGNNGQNAGVMQGIVKNNLGDDGYPLLSGDQTIVGGNTESLAYLFDSSTNANKKAYSNVQNLLQLDNEGYYYYDSTKNYAEFNEDTNSFTVYDDWAIRFNSGNDGEFFPFNPANTVDKTTSANAASLNHYFGLSLTTRFIQKYNGYTDASHGKATTFEFSGDDDVWIFVDNVLVADLGGIHDAQSVTIDFAEGTVKISTVYGKTGEQTRNFSEIFQDTNVELETYNGKTTLKNDTTHTLKFFYLERGGSASNLRLKYNLTEIPATSIYKVDQYGEEVGGAGFAVYKADENYHYLVGNTSVALQDGYTVNPDNGVITSGGTTISPAYWGMTNSQGEMIFVDKDGMPYSISELKQLLGEHFILREYKVPAGYRTVSEEVKLYIKNDIIFAKDSYESGVWAAPNAQITATNTLSAALSYSTTAQSLGWTQQSTDDGQAYYTHGYYDPATSESNGTLFAVVLKRNGAGETAYDDWHPVYGSEADGYDVMEGTATVENVLTAARNQQQYGSTVFTYSASGMQTLMENLPGKAGRYYTYVRDHGKLDGYEESTEPQYVIAYYYTTADSLDGANAGNTVRISSHTETTPTGAFSVQWGSTIEVPNIGNRLLFLKMQSKDHPENRFNDATVALYQVDEDAGQVYSIADDNTHIYLSDAQETADGAVVGAAHIGTAGGTSGTFAIDKETGVITITAGGTTYTISPAKNALGNSCVEKTKEANPDDIYQQRDGVGYFIRLLEGRYVLREIAAPKGFGLNLTETKVLVNKQAVYANAGTADDGVSVANGPGYLVSTMNKFASRGDIDETLSWLYILLRLNPDQTFAGFGNTSTWQYVTRDANVAEGYGGSSLTSERGESMISYMVYNRGDANTLFSYSPNENQNARTAIAGSGGVNTLAGEGTQRLYTDVGWGALAAYQDYAFGKTTATANQTTNYDNITGRDLTHLLSNSTFVRVEDPVKVDLTVVKTGSDGTEEEPQYLDGAEFTLTNAAGQYYDPANGSWVTVTEDAEAPALTTATQGDKKAYFTISGLSDGTYTLTETKSPNGNYEITGSPWTIVVGAQTITVTDAEGNQTQVATKLTVNGAPWTEMTDTDPYYNAASLAAQYRLDVVNTYKDAVIDIHVKKVGADAANPADQSPLAGAKFVLYRENAGESANRTYYIAGTGNTMPTWGARDDATVFESSGAEASFTISGLAAGTYYLMEVEAPAGHSQMTGVIPIVITTTADAAHTTTAALGDGYPNDDVAFDAATNTVTVKNYAGYELPETGGTGTTLFTLGGLLILAATLVYGYGLRRRQERRTR